MWLLKGNTKIIFVVGGGDNYLLVLMAPLYKVRVALR